MLVTAGWLVCWKYDWQVLGRRNADPPFPFTYLGFFSLLLWPATLVGLGVVGVFARRGSRRLAVAVLLSCLLVVTPLQCRNARDGLDAYDDGFAQWARVMVSPGPILAWAHALPPTTQSTTVAPSACPPMIAALRPTNVIRRPNGVILEWGMYSTWGTARRIYITSASADELAQDEESYNFNWKKAGPQCYVALQAPG